jgi:hypothetical protein
MSRVKFDGVVDAVHYTPDGQVAWVRAYERRGPTFSDHVLIDRSTLIARLKAGKRFWVGKRQPLKASTFDLSQPVRLLTAGGRDVLGVGDTPCERDCLEGAPVI